MPLRKQTGNMYEFVNYTWNPIKGACIHDCVYCYMKKWGTPPPLRLHDDELKTDLGRGKFIFVGSGTDMFASNVPVEDIDAVLEVCRHYPENQYLFQSKNPGRFEIFAGWYPPKCIFGTTIETNREHGISKAPPMIDRAEAMEGLIDEGCTTMVTIEPILDFDLHELVYLIERCEPSWVNIGADSKGNNLPEPDAGKVAMLKTALEEHGIKVLSKKNLNRLDRR